ncbi:MAG: 6-carboxytetrahydropterin synthase QueD [Spirochaetae bacterium HGW-Spirochaetae-7]|jgi:6-pyruvoyltetrahydropterin/6-carboxytetrahydropterin synthase|nr:MAG: 6-carboxytetrahydropterin synthase QueD [Spirochaetae bacterium HGW-Spirochaetae-7]
MYVICVETSFAAAHFLTEFHGKCERLHGHNYVVRAYARGETLDKAGMLVDFGEVKGRLRQVCETLDHSCLNDNPVFASSPSAERIARHVFEEIARLDASIPLSAVEVFETATSMARYEP